MQQLQQLRNLEELLKAQTRTRPLLEANLAAGLIDIAQVDQFRQNIETERANMLTARNQFSRQPINSKPRRSDSLHMSRSN